MTIMARPDVPSIVDFLRRHESHPPGYYVLGHALQRMGLPLYESLDAISLLTSVALIPTTLWLGVRIAGALCGLIAASVTAFAPGLFLYSVQARPYSLIAMAVVAGTACLLQFGASGRPRWLLGWGGLMTIGVSLHYTTLLYVAAQGIVCAVAWSRDARWRLRGPALLAGFVALILALAPLIRLAAGQSRVAGYDAVRPFSWGRPVAHLARVILDYPLELGVPVLLAAAYVARLMLPRSKGAAGAREAQLLAVQWVGLIFVGLCFLGSYRSRLTLPHVLMSSVPFGALLIGHVVTRLYRQRRLVASALSVELVIGCLALSWLLRVGYFKTNADIVARTVMDRSEPGDLLILMPGLLGASVNRTFDQRIAQIDFPYPGPVRSFPFDHYFERMTDTAALAATLRKGGEVLERGHAVWLVVPAGWHMESVTMRLALPEDSVSGIAQADVIRANQLQRALEVVSGAPDSIGTFSHGPEGHETLNLFRYSTRRGSTAGQLQGS